VGVQPGRKIFNTLIKKGAARIEDRLKIFLSGAPVCRRKGVLAVGGWRGGESAFCPAAKTLRNMSRAEAGAPCFTVGVAKH